MPPIHLHYSWQFRRWYQAIWHLLRWIEAPPGLAGQKTATDKGKHAKHATYTWTKSIGLVGKYSWPATSFKSLSILRLLVAFIAPIQDNIKLNLGWPQVKYGQMGHKYSKSSTTKQRLSSNIQQVFEFNASRRVFTTGSSCFADWTFSWGSSVQVVASKLKGALQENPMI